METDKTSPAQSAPLYESYRPNKLLQYGAYATSLVMGTVSATTIAWGEFYDKIKNTGPFKAYREDRLNKLDNLAAEVFTLPVSEARTSWTTNQKPPSEARSTWVEGRKLIEKEYTTLMNDGLEKHMGIATQGIVGKTLGTFQRFRELGPFKMQKIGITAASGTGVVLGAYFLINQGLRLKAGNAVQDQNLRELSNRIDAQERKHDALLEQGISH